MLKIFCDNILLFAAHHTLDSGFLLCKRALNMLWKQFPFSWEVEMPPVSAIGRVALSKGTRMSSSVRKMGESSSFVYCRLRNGK